MRITTCVHLWLLCLKYLHVKITTLVNPTFTHLNKPGGKKHNHASWSHCKFLTPNLSGSVNADRQSCWAPGAYSFSALSCAYSTPALPSFSTLFLHNQKRTCIDSSTFITLNSACTPHSVFPSAVRDESPSLLPKTNRPIHAVVPPPPTQAHRCTISLSSLSLTSSSFCFPSVHIVSVAKLMSSILEVVSWLHSPQ